MLYKFVEAQFKYPNKNDWTLQVKQDLEYFGIPGTLDFLRSKSINSFKRLVKIKTKEHALNYLSELKSTCTKLDNLMYSDLSLQKYLKSDNIPVYEAKNLFR